MKTQTMKRIGIIATLAIGIALVYQHRFDLNLEHKEPPAIIPPSNQIAETGITLPHDDGNGVDYHIGFYYGSWRAVSNAYRFKKPPEGYSILCDNAGHYTPSAPYSGDCSWDTNMVATNYFKAVILAWRNDEILHPDKYSPAPPRIESPHYDFHLCEPGEKP